MSLTVVGSVAFDALETPFGKRDRVLGGAATHFGLSASFFTQVNAVGVVGGAHGNRTQITGLEDQHAAFIVVQGHPCEA